MTIQDLLALTDDKGFITLHEPNEDGDAGDLVASVWRDDWLDRLRTALSADVTQRATPEVSMTALVEALEAAQDQLRKASDQFAFYADAHAKKGTPDGDAKGATNMAWARSLAQTDHACRAALQAVRQTEGK